MLSSDYIAVFLFLPDLLYYDHKLLYVLFLSYFAISSNLSLQYVSKFSNLH